LSACEHLIFRPLGNHLPLELGEIYQNVPEQPARRGRRIQPLGHADHMGPCRLELLQQRMKVFHGARQAVELRDDDVIDLTPLEVKEESLELRSLQRAGGSAGSS
jgi:hypothetical protein